MNGSCCQIPTAPLSLSHSLSLHLSPYSLFLSPSLPHSYLPPSPAPLPLCRLHLAESWNRMREQAVLFDCGSGWVCVCVCLFWGTTIVAASAASALWACSFCLWHAAAVATCTIVWPAQCGCSLWMSTTAAPQFANWAEPSDGKVHRGRCGVRWKEERWGAKHLLTYE